MFHYAVHCVVLVRCGELVAGGYVGLWSENSETVTVTPHQVQAPCLRRSVSQDRTRQARRRSDVLIITVFNV